MKKDYSKEIFENYFSKKNKIIEVELKDGRILSGIFVNFVQGERDFDEPYIVKWHFIPEEEIEKYQSAPRDFDKETGTGIEQKNIKNVRFKIT